ncbi:MAG: DUF2339 domain-containing protein [Flavobacteriales bacterium]|nr:DUF2339 domain-containing protein [Flavobacteriales bacterium]
MEGALVLVALIPIALLILAIITASRTGSIVRQLDELRKEVAVLRKALADRTTPAASAGQPPPQAPPAPTMPPITATGDPWYAGMREPGPRVFHAPETGPAQVAPEPKVETPPSAQPPPRIVISEPAPLTERIAADAPRQVVMEPARPAPPRTPPPAPQKGAWDRFLDSNPDLEKFIGENLINKIGIAVLVLGLGFLLRYAIGKNYINEVGRVLIGVASGGVLMFIAHRLRLKLRAFSSVLVAGGISVLYFTIAIAYRSYDDMFTQTQAFAIMVVITALAVVFSIAYDRRELAVIALIGGFAAPFMVSDGEGNFKVLFSYLLILNVGMLVLALLKRWNIVHLVAYGLTLLLFGAWAIDPYTDLVPRPWKWGFLFATGFHLVFFAMAVGYNLRYNLKFRPLEFALLIGNTATYYAVGMHFLTDAPSYPMQKWTGLFTAALGLFHIVFAFVFYRRKQVPRNLVLLLIGLALTFCTLAVPVQLEGYTITIFWAAEAVLLLWFSQRAALPMVARGSVLVAVLAVISLVMDLDGFYSILRPELRPIINPGWITGMVVVVCMVGLHLLFRREKDERDVLPAISIRSCANGALVLAVALGYLVNLLELRNQSARFLSVDGVRMITMAFTLAYVLGLDLFTRRAGKQVRVVVFGLSILALIGYVTTFYEASGDSLKEMLTASARGFGIHYIGLVLGVAVVVRVAQQARLVLPRPSGLWNAYLWSMCLFLVVMASQELDHAMLWANYSAEEAHYLTLNNARRAGYPILWGIGSFLFMWYGMRTKLKTVRVIALVLFGITLLKLFLVDLRGISEGGKVAAFICLGILLLVVSFMYNKLKGLFVDEDKNSEAVKP